jgi:hypothetical protein
MKKSNTIERRISARISRKKCTVLLREDFADLANYGQVGRVLRRLVAKGVIMKIGYGLYAKAHVCRFSGELVPDKCLPDLAREALHRLGIETVLNSLEIAYNEGRTTSISTGRLIGVTKPVRRKIGYDGTYVSYERVSEYNSS